MILPDPRVSIRAVLLSSSITDVSGNAISPNQIVAGWAFEQITLNMPPTLPMISILPIATRTEWLSIGGTRKIHRTKIAIDVWTSDLQASPQSGKYNNWVITKQIVNAINSNQFNHYSDFGIFYMWVTGPIQDLTRTDLVPTIYRNRISVEFVWLETIPGG